MNRTLLLGALLIGCANPSESPETTLPRDPTVVNVFTLPDARAFPDGVAIAPDSRTFYVTGALDGTIYRGTTDSANLRRWVGATGPAAGLVVTRDSLLVVAGRKTGRIVVHDLRRPGFVRQVTQAGSSPADLRAVALGSDGAAYVADAKRDSLYVLRHPDQPSSTLDAIPLDGIVPYSRTAEAENLTGLTATADGRLLVGLHHDLGKLYRVELATASVVEISLSGPVSLVGGDGLMLHQGTLYVSVGARNQIVPVALSDDLRSGTVSSFITHPRLRYPTHAIRTDVGFLVVNSQRNALTDQSPVSLPFTVVRIPLPPLPVDR